MPGSSRNDGDARGGTHEDNLGFVELLLDLHDGVGLSRVLVLADGLSKLGVADGLGPRFRCKVVEQLLE
jgi:hypothetical protein